LLFRRLCSPKTGSKQSEDEDFIFGRKVMDDDSAPKNKTERIRATPYRTRDRAFCPQCDKPVKLLSFAEAAGFLNTGLENILRLAERRELHRLHNRKGVVMLCAESLFHILNNRPKPFDHSGEFPPPGAAK
jgi:hypothetical protein